MILCLVTDRRRFASRDGLLEQLAAAAAAGVDLIQIREGDMEAGDLLRLVRDSLACVAGTETKVLVNDRLDVALAARAHGVHLKEQSFSPTAVRRIAPDGFLIGASVHASDTVTARKDADFLVAGTVSPTASKPGADTLDEVGLRAIVSAAAGKPVIGIGGLDASSMPILAASGASGLAAISAFIPETNADISEGVKKRVTDLRFALETGRART